MQLHLCTPHGKRTVQGAVCSVWDVHKALMDVAGVLLFLVTGDVGLFDSNVTASCHFIAMTDLCS